MSFAVTGAILGGLSVASTVYGANQARGAAREVQRGADAATAESGRQYDQTRADLSSGRSLYEGANSLLGQLYGIPIQSSAQFQNEQPLLVGDTELPAGTTTKSVGNGWYEVHYGGQRIGTLRPGGANGQFINDSGADINALFEQRRQQAAPNMGGGTPGQPNMGGFFTSPDYNFRRGEGTRDIQQSFAARGGGQSGNALRALAEFNSNLASGEFGNYFNRLTTLAGLGSAATSDTAAYGARHAENAGRNALIAGDARASGIENRANLIGQGVNTLGGIAGYYANRRQPQPYGGTGAGSFPWTTPGYGDGVRYGYGDRWR
jgi:hypothetical protein